MEIVIDNWNKTRFIKLENHPIDNSESRDVHFSVSMTCRGYSGHDDGIYIMSDALQAFTRQLKYLEQQRHGSVSLAAIGVKHEEDFCLEVFSIDRLGHIAVKASLRRPNYVGGNLHPLELSIAFEMDAEKFGTFVREFEALMTQI